MIHNQCRAYCQCEFCKNGPAGNGKGDVACLNIKNANCDGTGPSKDELYAKCLKQTLDNRALIASMRNANRFVPDEMLVSSRKRREAKEAELASLLVPVRRRDRLEEMLLLENQARLREEMRVRAERRALGLPEDEQEEQQNAVHEESAPSTGSNRAPSTTSSQQRQRRLGSGNSTPASRCSADHDLRRTLHTLQDIMNEDPEISPNQPLTRNQVLQLRKLVHEQSKKTRKMVDDCPNQPHLCPHCFAVNVQGKHLCPQMAGSVAYRTTGKIINPDGGVKHGTADAPMANGQYSDHMDSNMLGKHARIKNFNTHPHGTGVVFLPVTRTEGGVAPPVKPRHEFYNGRNQPVFNNNIGDSEPAQGEYQYPGSTYNVYDGRHGAYGAEGGDVAPFAPVNGAAVEAGRGNNGNNNNKNCGCGVTFNTAEGGASHVNPNDNDPMKGYKTTSSLWRTTNQDRETDMQRFLDFQKGRMNATGKQVYDESASRFAPAAKPEQGN